MTVFVVHGVRDDISPARRFGSLSLINHAYIHGDELERCGEDNVVPSWCVARINTAVGMFNPATDFLLIAGDHLQLLAMAAILTARFGTFMVLRYDRQLNDYIPVRLHSGLVPPPAVVVESGTDIGDHEHGKTFQDLGCVAPQTNESRNQAFPVCDYCEKRHDTRLACPEYVASRRPSLERLRTILAGIEAPLSRRDPKRPA